MSIHDPAARCILVPHFLCITGHDIKVSTNDGSQICLVDNQQITLSDTRSFFCNMKHVSKASTWFKQAVFHTYLPF